MFLAEVAMQVQTLQTSQAMQEYFLANSRPGQPPAVGITPVMTMTNGTATMVPMNPALTTTYGTGFAPKV